MVVVARKERSIHTTSAVAAAFWYPYMASPQDKVMRWGQESFDEFTRLATAGDTGIKWWRFLDVTPGLENPWWATVVKNFAKAAADELPEGVESGVSFDSLIIDSSIYLPYLEQSLLALGGLIIDREIKAFDQCFIDYDFVVNCSGLGACSLAKDDDLHPARGQIVRIKRNATDIPALSLSSHDRFAHSIPRANDTVLGGTFEEFNEDPVPSETESSAIIERCKEFLPRLANLNDDDILESRCGFRPLRSQIRLEREEFASGKFVIHNYGHGGAGFSMSWGCADDVVRLLDVPSGS